MKRSSVVLAIAALFIAAIASAQPRPEPPQKALAEYLQLTDAQITSWQQIQKDAHAAVQPLADKARDLHTQIDTALEAASPDATAVGKLVIALRSTEGQIKAVHDDAKAKRLAVLNAEQKTKLEAFEAAMKFARRDGPRRGPGAGARTQPPMPRH